MGTHTNCHLAVPCWLVERQPCLRPNLATTSRSHLRGHSNRQYTVLRHGRVAQEDDGGIPCSGIICGAGHVAKCRGKPGFAGLARMGHDLDLQIARLPCRQKIGRKIRQAVHDHIKRKRRARAQHRAPVGQRARILQGAGGQHHPVGLPALGQRSVKACGGGGACRRPRRRLSHRRTAPGVRSAWSSGSPRPMAGLVSPEGAAQSGPKPTGRLMTTLTATQSLILSRAAQRPGNFALTLPPGLAGAAAKMAVSRMIDLGWLAEVDANLPRGEPLWRETGDGHGTTLVATETGLVVIGIEQVVARTMAAVRNREVAEPDSTSMAEPPNSRPGTKQALLIAMLQAPAGHYYTVGRSGLQRCQSRRGSVHRGAATRAAQHAGRAGRGAAVHPRLRLHAADRRHPYRKARGRLDPPIRSSIT